MIKTFWFDLGNVILPFDFTPAYSSLSDLSGIPAGEFESFFKRHPELEALLDEGKVSGADLYSMLKDELKMSGVSFDQFKRIWNDIFTENTSVSDLIRWLKKNHRQLILISNTNLLHFDHIRKTYPVISEFDHLVLSYELRTRKPEKEIYHHALELSDAEPDQILYVDDRADLTSAAASHGVHTHTFLLYENLHKHLSELKVH